MPRVLWSNGREDAARSWVALLEVVRTTQFRVIAPDKFRDELARRAWLWSGTYIDPESRPRDLFEQLEKAHLLKILPVSGNMQYDNNERTD